MRFFICLSGTLLSCSTGYLMIFSTYDPIGIFISMLFLLGFSIELGRTIQINRYGSLDHTLRKSLFELYSSITKLDQTPPVSYIKARLSHIIQDAFKN